MGIEVTLSGFLSLFFPSDGCGAGFVCLNVSTLEELHSCGHLDHIGGFAAHTHTRAHGHTLLTHTLTGSHVGLAAQQHKAFICQWSSLTEPPLHYRHSLSHTHAHTHTDTLSLSLSQTHAHTHFEKVPFLFFFSLKPGSNLLFSGN